MGFDSLSMSANNLPKVKAAIREVTMADAQRVLAAVLQLYDEKEIQRTVNKALQQLMRRYRKGKRAVH